MIGKLQVSTYDLINHRPQHYFPIRLVWKVAVAVVDPFATMDVGLVISDWSAMVMMMKAAMEVARMTFEEGLSYFILDFLGSVRSFIRSFVGGCVA